MICSAFIFIYIKSPKFIYVILKKKFFLVYSRAFDTHLLIAMYKNYVRELIFRLQGRNTEVPIL